MEVREPCSVCGHTCFDDSVCVHCDYFNAVSRCAFCDEKIISVVKHTCEKCGYCECDCNCPPSIKESKIVRVYYDVTVQVHEPKSNHEIEYASFDSIEEAIKAWDFGTPRPGEHHWDRNACHVAQNPETGKWALLYM